MRRSLAGAGLLGAAMFLGGHLFAQSRQATVESPEAEQLQPESEKIDLVMYGRIRDEGLNHSHVMELASALADDIGGRLTGSPNMAKANAWTRDTLTRLGLTNAHLDDWGEFGMGWQQLNVWARMTSPDTAPLIVQATPWSPSTNGPISGQLVQAAVESEKDLDKYKGKLGGKIVLLGAMRPVPPVDQPLFRRYTDSELNEIATFPGGLQQRDLAQRLARYRERAGLRERLPQFLLEEKAAGVILPSRDGRDGGGSGGTFFDDNGAALGLTPYKKDKAVKIPVVVAAIENYGRLYRLVEQHVPVTVEMNVETKFTGNDEHGFDTVAEIEGSDPKLKNQIVMLGGHLDSWASATGATDNGAGTVVAMEAVRILKALDIKPRRTIRIALWSGEEEGLFGSKGYVKEHFGSFPLSTAPAELKMPEYLRSAGGPIEVKPEWRTLDAYYNVDNGSGRARGIYLQGNAAVEPIFRKWIAPLKDLGVTTISMRNTGGTDHLSFDAVGLPGFQFIQDPLAYETRSHHSNMDTYERLQPGDLAQLAVVEATFVYNTAMRDEMIPRKPFPHPELLEQQNSPLKDLFPGAQPPPEKTER